MNFNIKNKEEMNHTDLMSGEKNKRGGAKKVTCSLREMFNRVDREPKIPMLYSVIKEGSVGLVYGVAKTGKTIFCENLAMSIASGRNEFLGKAITTDNRKILFISLEEFYEGRTVRNQKQFLALNDAEQEAVLNNYVVVNENIPKVISTKEDWGIIENAIVDNGAGVVFIDSLTRMIDGQIENSDIARNTMLNIREIAERLRVTIVMVHHSVKMEEEQALTLQKIAGSRIISQEADFILGINKTSNNTRYLKIVAARYADDNIDTVDKFEFNEHLWVNVTGQIKEQQLLNPVFDKRKSDDNLNLIVDTISKLGGRDQLIDVRALSNSLVLNGLMSEPTLYSNLKKGQNNGTIESPEKGKYRLLAVN